MTANQGVTRFLACLTFLAATAAGAAEPAPIYKWTDAEGRVHFSDHAPRGVQAVKVALPESSGVLSPPKPKADAPRKPRHTSAKRTAARDDETPRRRSRPRRHSVLDD